MGRTRDAADALGFQVRRDIRNRPLREVDRAGQRRMWSTTLVVLCVLGVLLSITVLRNHLNHLGAQIERLQAKRASLEAERRHLVAEHESLRALTRIEHLATTQLKLVKPTDANAFVLERVKTSPGPTSAVVARR
jgi:cell division protein FtsL